MLSSLHVSRITAAIRGQHSLVVALCTSRGAVATPQQQRIRQFSSDDDKVISRETLAIEIAEEHDLTKAKSRRIVDSIFDGVVDGVSDGAKARISAFGIFESKLSPARNSRNPKTGEAVMTPAKQRVRFKASSVFKNAVNGK